MAIYTKHGKKIIKESITVDGDCYVGNNVIKIRAVVEGRNGKQEIQDVINANNKR